MKVQTNHLRAIRNAYSEAPSHDLMGLYTEMAISVRPKITDAMMNATKLIIDGNTVEEASEALGVSKVAISQAAVKGLNRLAQFYAILGGKLPEDLEGEFNLPKAKLNMKVFPAALAYFLNPEQSISAKF